MFFSPLQSLITELADEASFGSFLYLQKGGWVKYWVVVTDQDLYALKAPKVKSLAFRVD